MVEGSTLRIEDVNARLKDIVTKDQLKEMEDRLVLTFQGMLTAALEKHNGKKKDSEEQLHSSATLRSQRCDNTLVEPFSHNLSDSRQTETTAEKHQENHEFLMRCIKEDLGFKDGKPLAACIIFKCLLHWRAFESDSSTTVQIVAEGITNVLQVGEVNYILPYWLSNVSTLLCLLHKNLRYNGFFSMPSQSSAGYSGVAGRMTQGLFSPLKHLGGEENMQINTQYPAIFFKQKLTNLVGNIFNLIRDKLIREISPLLNLCLQAPKATGGVPQQSLSSRWDSIIKFLDSLLSHLHGNHVPSFFIRKITTQVFSFINLRLFNSLLMRRECCTFTNGKYWNSGLDELEKWAVNVTKEFAGSSVHKLTHIKQAVRFLLIHEKNKKSLDEITQDLCPALTVLQIYRICTTYWDYTYGTKSVSAEVVEQMREIVQKESRIINLKPFLLDDDSSIPFSAEDILKALPEVDTSDVEPPPFLHEYPCAQFLIEQDI